MVVCPSCGATLVPPFRFCPSCGRPVPEKLPYPPPATYVPPQKNNAVLIVVVLVVVVIVFSIALPAILYVMVSGLIGSGPPPMTKPTVTLTATKITGGVSVLVAGIAPTASPSNFKVDIQNATSFVMGTAVPMPATAGTSAQVTVSGVTFTIVWGNPGGSGQVSQGDTFVVTYVAAPGTQWTFFLIWAGDGSVVSRAPWQA